LKSLFIISQFYPIEAGAERQAFLLARYLGKNGTHVTVVTGRWSREIPRRECLNGVWVYRNFTLGLEWDNVFMRYVSGFVYMLSLTWFLLFKGAKYDVYHVHQAFYPAFAAVLFKRILQKPVIVKVGGGGINNNDLMLMKSGRYPLGKWMLKTIMKADMFIAISPQIEKELVLMEIPKKKIVSIPNGVEVPDTGKKDYKLQSPAKIVFTGRLNPEKRCDLLVEALGEICDEIPICCDIFGDGPLKESLEKEVAEKNLESFIDFKGYVGNLRNFLVRYDVFVLPSEAEGMSNALLEAMAAGLSCVVSDIPPNRELVDPGRKRGEPKPGDYVVCECGILFRSGDSAGLAKALRFLCEDEKIREKIGKNARARVLNDFAIKRVAEEYVTLYHDVLGG